MKKEKDEVKIAQKLQISTKNTFAIVNIGYNTYLVQKFTELERHLDSNHGGA